MTTEVLQTPPIAAGTTLTAAPPSGLAAFWHDFRRNAGAVIGLAIILFVTRACGALRR